jgi:cephalosporin-C deacetylase-like acetyl esterase
LPVDNDAARRNDAGKSRRNAEFAMPDGTVVEEDVSFYSGPKLKLAARIYHPPQSQERRAPGIVMCHGFGGVKEENPPGLARLLAAAGYRIFTWDYRGFGGSEGVRGRMVPGEQIEDAATAVEHFASRDDVDADRVGVYGSSYGGGVVSGVLLKDTHAKAAALGVPAVGGRLGVISRYDKMGLTGRARAAIVKKTKTGEIEMIERSEILVGDPVTDARYAGRSYPIALESLVHIAEGMTPHDWAPSIKHPVLCVTVATDQLGSPQAVKEYHDRLGGPKKLHVFPSGTHYSIYDELLQDHFAVVRPWYDQYLRQ